MPYFLHAFRGRESSRIVKLAVGVCLILAPSLLSASQHKDARPNIVLIMADDLGYECLGCYGGTSYKTPNLDKLARGGIRFTNCFSTPKCSPSRVTIMTGRYTPRTTNVWGHLPPKEITFGHVLQKAGYATALAGKWQMTLLNDDPLHVARSGFAQNCCWAWHEGPRYWQPWIWQNGRLKRHLPDRYGPDVYCDFLIDFIGSQEKQNHRQPWLAYYPMTLCHFPKSNEPKGPNGRWETFAEMVAEMDRQVGRIVAELDRLKLRDETLILFVGDNGSPTRVTSQCNGGAIRGGKASLSDAGTRVPLLANWPDTVESGKINSDLIDFSDFLPTVAELAGTALPESVIIDGRSFAQRLLDLPGDPREWVYTQWQDKSWARGKRWKLYDNGDLFDMVADPAERKPIRAGADTPESNAARKKLDAVLTRIEHEETDG